MGKRPDGHRPHGLYVVKHTLTFIISACIILISMSIEQSESKKVTNRVPVLVNCTSDAECSYFTAVVAGAQLCGRCDLTTYQCVQYNPCMSISSCPARVNTVKYNASRPIVGIIEPSIAYCITYDSSYGPYGDNCDQSDDGICMYQWDMWWPAESMCTQPPSYHANPAPGVTCISDDPCVNVACGPPMSGVCLYQNIPGCCHNDSECTPIDPCHLSVCNALTNTCTMFNDAGNPLEKDCAAERCINEVAESGICSVECMPPPECGPFIDSFFDIYTEIALLKYLDSSSPLIYQLDPNCAGFLDLCAACILGYTNPNVTDFDKCIFDSPCHGDACLPNGTCAYSDNILYEQNLCLANQTCVVSLTTGIPGRPYMYNISCDDHNPNTIDTCNPNTGNCEHYYIHCKDCPCKVECDDHNLCTMDSCNHRNGCCIHDPIDCNADGNKCIVRACSSSDGCHEVWRRDCDDHNECTMDRCNPDTGDCEHIPKVCPQPATKCSWPVCDKATGQCIMTGPMVDDGNVCTLDGCDDLRGVYHNPVLCLESIYPCLMSVCMNDAGGCGYLPLDCDDHDICTEDNCNSIQGTCSHVPIDCNCTSTGRLVGNPCMLCGCSSKRGGCWTAPVDCDDHNACTSDSCGSNGECVHMKTHCGCTEDGLIVDDACHLCWCSNEMGGCQTASVNCDDHNPLTDDRCDLITGCYHVARECPDDGDMCTDEKLDRNTGACLHKRIDCDDHDACTFDNCSSPIGCTHMRKDCGQSSQDLCYTYGCDRITGECATPILKDCDDKNPCTEDACIAGMCVHRQSMGPPGVPIVMTPCHEWQCHADRGGWILVSKDCGDNNPCTEDICDDITGECIHKERYVCTTNKTCHYAKCNRMTGQCEEYAMHYSDNDLCTNDFCYQLDNGTTIVTHVYKCETNITNKCIAKSWCDHRTGKCETKELECDDHNPCTDDSCNPFHGCIHTPKNCADTDPCTTDYCSVDQGGCRHTRITCDDDDASTTDTCIPDPVAHGLHKCVHVKEPCSDSDKCTFDWRDEKTGECHHKPKECSAHVHDRCILGSCSQDTGECVYERKICQQPHNPCFKVTCDPATGLCGEPKKKECDDHRLCTIDSCNENTGQCEHTAIVCDDHNLCTKDSCDPDTGACTYDMADCSDGNPCTNDTCDPAIGECIHPQRHDCDTADLCMPGYCDKHTGACVTKRIDCDDKNWCTDDMCDPGTGRCLHVQRICPPQICMNAACDPGSGKCIYTKIDCDDGEPRTKDWCDMKTGHCKHIRNPCWKKIGEKPTHHDEDGDHDDHHHSSSLSEVHDHDHDHDNDHHDHHEYSHNHHDNDHHEHHGDHEYHEHHHGFRFPEHDNSSDHDHDHDNDHHDHHDDGDDLCHEYYLDELTGKCVYKEKDCDDKNPCTKDTCVKGECIHHTMHCDDHRNCTDDHCDPLTGKCVFKEKDCSDDTYCTTDRCEERTGLCIHDPVMCNADGLPAATPTIFGLIDYDPSSITTNLGYWKKCVTELCFGGNGQCYPVYAVCDDHNACTTDTCVPGVGCVNVPKNCSDGLLCTHDLCDKLTGECYNPMIDCDDHIPVTIDTCNTATGKCEHVVTQCENKDPCVVNATNKFDGKCYATPRDCRDDDVCTEDYCIRGECAHKHKDCDDHNVCTHDHCDKHTGNCTHKEIDCEGHCKCKIYGCNPEKGCYDLPKTCDDANKCTNDECVPMTGECVNTPIDIDDHDMCTDDSCVNGIIYHIPRICDDFNPCTIDHCDHRTGECIHKERECIPKNKCFVAKCEPCTQGDMHHEHEKDKDHDHDHDHEHEHHHNDDHDHDHEHEREEKPRGDNKEGDHRKPEHHEHDHDHDHICRIDDNYFDVRSGGEHPPHKNVSLVMYKCVQRPIKYREEECVIKRCDERTGKEIRKNVEDGTPCKTDNRCHTHACRAGKCIMIGTRKCDEDEHGHKDGGGHKDDIHKDDDHKGDDHKDKGHGHKGGGHNDDDHKDKGHGHKGDGHKDDDHRDTHKTLIVVGSILGGIILLLVFIWVVGSFRSRYYQSVHVAIQ